MEQILSKNIDKCLSKKNFGSLKIPTIYRIITKCKKTQIFHDKLFDFIAESIDTRSILFSFLEIGKLSLDRLEKMFNSYTKYKQCLNFLQTDIEYIKKIKEEKENLEKQVTKLKQELEKNKPIENPFKIQLEKENNQLKEKVGVLTKENNNLTNDKQNLVKKNIKYSELIKSIFNNVKDLKDVRVGDVFFQ